MCCCPVAVTVEQTAYQSTIEHRIKIDTVLMVYPLDKEVMNNVNTGANNGDKSFV
jgi:hypothetical protein